MGVDELKLIGEMLSQLGAQGKEAFIWWVVLDKIPSFILWGCFVGVLYRVVIAIQALNSEVSFFTEMRDKFGLGNGYLSSSEVYAVMTALRDLAEKQGKRGAP